MGSDRSLDRRGFLNRAAKAALGGSAMFGMPYVALNSVKARPKPNFLFILVDDLGWADLSCYGSTFHESPNIDRLASEGMRFTDAYAACPVCSPTRASILTGKYPATLDLTDFIPGHWRPWAKLTVPEFNQQLPLEETTIAEALKDVGYMSASLGKWHLGGPNFFPKQQGFDYALQRPENHNDKWVSGLTAEALQFIETNKDRRFFLYLAHYTVHIPLEARQELIDKYQARVQPEAGQRNPIYAAMIETLDKSVKQLLDKLEDLKLTERTVVIFFSDNGGLVQNYRKTGPIVTSNAPLRAEKGTLYEGGIRVPLIIRWPEVVPAGSLCKVPVTSTDFFPTILQLAGVDHRSRREVDGKSLVPLLTQSGPLKREAIYWHYPHYHHCAPCGAIRQGKFKLIEFYEDGALELYDIDNDIGETNNLAEQMPERTARLRRKLSKWRKAVNARMPTPNPNYDPTRAHEWGNRRKKRQ